MPHGDIWDYYEKIFAADPLLLHDESQETYRDGVLKHLLLNRTMNAFSPMLVDLHNPTDRESFDKRMTFAGPCPPDETVKRYRQKRVNRGNLSKKDRACLEPITMVSRGEFTVQRRPKGYDTHDAAIAALKKAKSSIEKRLRIAAIGYRVQVSKLEKQGHLNEELCIVPQIRRALVAKAGDKVGALDLGRTQSSSTKALKEWDAAVSAHIETALKRKCHFIIAPEFALPPRNSGRKPIEDRLFERSRQDGTDDHFMFAGSRHEGGSNRGLVITRQGAKPSEPWWHHKVAPARGLGENIFGPHGTKRPSYAAKFQIRENERPNFPVDIAICYDSFDPTMFLTLILQSRVSTDGEIRPRMLLVPSFNTSKDFVALLRDLSFISRSVVVYVNGLHGDAKMYICGFAVADFIDRKRANNIRRQLRAKAKELNNAQQLLLQTFQLNPDQATEVNSLKGKIEAAIALESALRDLQKARAFDGVITVQGHAAKASAISGRFDPSDLLYYNIDMGLLYALFKFRAQYFGNDLFMPKPFQFDELKNAAIEMRKKIEKEREREEAARRASTGPLPRSA